MRDVVVGKCCSDGVRCSDQCAAYGAPPSGRRQQDRWGGQITRAELREGPRARRRRRRPVRCPKAGGRTARVPVAGPRPCSAKGRSAAESRPAGPRPCVFCDNYVRPPRGGNLPSAAVWARPVFGRPNYHDESSYLSERQLLRVPITGIYHTAWYEAAARATRCTDQVRLDCSH